jgi:carboxypeptidase Taq
MIVPILANGVRAWATIYAAQFFAKAAGEVGDLADMFARGEFAPLLNWLREHIHTQGSRYRPRDLVRVVTGEERDSRFLEKYLVSKFSDLYGLK